MPAMSDGCGEKPCELLRISSQGSLWRRIPSAFLTMIQAARSEDSCGRLPRSGTYANGTLSPLPPLVPRTAANESGLWPTPTAQEPGWKNIEVVDRHGNPPAHHNQRFYDKNTGRLVQKGLTQAVRMWPTPTVFHALRGNHDEPLSVYLARVQDHKEGKTKGKPGPSLGIAVRMTDAVPGGGWQPSMNARNNGLLNPEWVEWLMGFPIGWTDCDASETQSCPKSPK